MFTADARRAMANLSIVSIKELHMIAQDKVVGLRVTLEVKLSKSMAVTGKSTGDAGSAIHHALRTMALLPSGDISKARLIGLVSNGLDLCAGVILQQLE